MTKKKAGTAAKSFPARVTIYTFHSYNIDMIILTPSIESSTATFTFATL